MTHLVFEFVRKSNNKTTKNSTQRIFINPRGLYIFKQFFYKYEKGYKCTLETITLHLWKIFIEFLTKVFLSYNHFYNHNHFKFLTYLY